MFKQSSLRPSLSSRQRVADAFSQNISTTTPSFCLKAQANPYCTSDQKEDEFGNTYYDTERFCIFQDNQSSASGNHPLDRYHTHLPTSDVGIHLIRENIAFLHYLCVTDAPYEVVNNFLCRFPELLDESIEMKNIQGWTNAEGQSPLDVVNQLTKSCRCGQCNINRRQVQKLFKCFRPDKQRKNCDSDECVFFESERSLDYYEDLLSTSGSVGDSDEEEYAKSSPKTKSQLNKYQNVGKKSDLTEENVMKRDKMEYELRHEIESLWYFHGDRIRSLLNQIEDIKYDKKRALEDLEKGEKQLERLHKEAESLSINPSRSEHSLTSNNITLRNRLMVFKHATSIKKRMIERDSLQSMMDKVCYDTGIAKIYCQSLERRITDLNITEARLETSYNALMESIFGPIEEQMKSLLGISDIPNCRERIY